MLRFASPPPAVSVAIPVRNEVARIGDCLRAFAAQRGSLSFDVVLLLNGCDDGTSTHVEALAASLPFRMRAIERRLPLGSGAGHARRLALQEAARGAPGAVLMTTDADAVVPPNWIARNLAALAGADAVAGQAVIDPVEALPIPARLHEDDARECAYAALLDEIASMADPDPADPWPRHDEHSGASIAVKATAYTAAGGIPSVALGEDRLFFRALHRIDARIRHDPTIRVVVSGRIEGRAAGDMADTMRRHMVEPDPTLDERLETAGTALLRAQARAALRDIWRRGDGVGRGRFLARRLRISAMQLREALSLPFLGAAWEAIEAASPILRRVPVPASAVLPETRVARRLLQGMRARISPLPADQAATTACAVAKVA
ncbi:MAG: glycosyltransferase family A protein [Acetobacteraceae bacterium]